jgi:hypothetical protein
MLFVHNFGGQYKKNYSLGIGLSMSKRLNLSDFCMTAINFAYYRVLLAISINKSQSIFIKILRTKPKYCLNKLDGLFWFIIDEYGAKIT